MDDPSFRDLHRSFDIALARFIGETGRLPSQTTCMEFATWLHSKLDERRWSS